MKKHPTFKRVGEKYPSISLLFSVPEISYDAVI